MIVFKNEQVPNKRPFHTVSPVVIVAGLMVSSTGLAAVAPVIVISPTGPLHTTLRCCCVSC